MKKVIAIILTGIISALMLTACSTAEDESGNEGGNNAFTETLALETEPTTTKEETTAETEAKPIDELPLVPDIPAAKISDDIDLTTITWDGVTFSIKGMTASEMMSQFETAKFFETDIRIKNNSFKFFGIPVSTNGKVKHISLECIDANGKPVTDEYSVVVDDETATDYTVKGLIIESSQQGNEECPIIDGKLNILMTREEVEDWLGEGYESVVNIDYYDKTMYFYENSEAVLGIKYKNEHDYDVVNKIMIIYK